MLAQRSKLARIVPSRSAVKAGGNCSQGRRLATCLPSGKAPTLPSSERQQRENTEKKKKERGTNFPVLRERLIANQRSIGSRARGKSHAPTLARLHAKIRRSRSPRPPLHRLSTSTPVVPRNLGLTALIKHRATLAYAARSRAVHLHKTGNAALALARSCSRMI